MMELVRVSLSLINVGSFLLFISELIPNPGGCF